MDPTEFQQDFLRRLGGDSRLDELLDLAMGVYFFAKDRDGKIVMANQMTVERCGCTDESQVIGRTDHDFFPLDLADKYVHDDRRVMETGEAIRGMIELAPDKDGHLDLYVTNKLPLRDTAGTVIGMAGTSTCHELRRKAMRKYLDIAPAVDYIKRHYPDRIHVPSLAELCGMPARRFSEQFKAVFLQSPQTFVVLVRVHYACQKLVRTDDPISEIAVRMGFYDHSNFTRQFAKHMGVTPLEYRKAHTFSGVG